MLKKFKNFTKEEFDKTFVFSRFFDDNYFGNCSLYTSKTNRNNCYFSINLCFKNSVSALKFLQESILFYSALTENCFTVPSFSVLTGNFLMLFFDFHKKSNFELKVIKLVADNSDLTENFKTALTKFLENSFKILHQKGFFYGHLYFDSILIGLNDIFTLKFFPFNFNEKLKFTFKANFINSFLDQTENESKVIYCNENMTKLMDLVNLKEFLFRISNIYSLHKYYIVQPAGISISTEFKEKIQTIKLHQESLLIIENNKHCNKFSNNQFMSEFIGQDFLQNKIIWSNRPANDELQRRLQEYLFTFFKQNEIIVEKGFLEIGHYSGEKRIGHFLHIGSIEFFDGCFYIGTICKNELHGFGIYLFKNGDIYIGEFDNSLFNGYGEYFHADGSFYQGFWLNGLKHGKGVYFEPEINRIYKGEWNEGVKNEHFVVYLLDTHLKTNVQLIGKDLKLLDLPKAIEIEELKKLLKSNYCKNSMSGDVIPVLGKKLTLEWELRKYDRKENQMFRRNLNNQRILIVDF